MHRHAQQKEDPARRGGARHPDGERGQPGLTRLGQGTTQPRELWVRRHISPPLSVAGTPSVKGTSGIVTVHGTLSGCHTATASVGPFAENITIHFPSTKPTKDQAALNAGDNPKSYYLGLCGTFASSATIKDLKKAVNNLPFQGGALKGPKPSEGTVGSDVGFLISGTVKGGTYPTASKAASIKAGLTNDANNTNLISGCHTGPVSTIDIDSSASTAVL